MQFPVAPLRAPRSALQGGLIYTLVGSRCSHPCIAALMVTICPSGRSGEPTQHSVTDSCVYKPCGNIREKKKHAEATAALFQPCIVLFRRIGCKRPATVPRRGTRRITEVILCGAREGIEILNKTLQGAPGQLDLVSVPTPPVFLLGNYFRIRFVL